MAWTQLLPDEPQLRLTVNGVLMWNPALQSRLTAPLPWVDLMWDPDTRRLGIRLNNHQDGWPVHQDIENGLYKIFPATALAAAGISVPEAVQDTPTRYHGGTDGHPAWYDKEPVYYITLP